jgi:hypothetical protein
MVRGRRLRELGFGLELAVEGDLVDTGTLGDVLGGSTCETARGEQRPSGIEDALVDFVAGASGAWWGHSGIAVLG